MAAVWPWLIVPFPLIQNVAGALDSNYSPDAESDVVFINLQSAAGVTCRGLLYSDFFSAVLLEESQKMRYDLSNDSILLSFIHCPDISSLNLNGTTTTTTTYQLPWSLVGNDPKMTTPTYSRGP